VRGRAGIPTSVVFHQEADAFRFVKAVEAAVEQLVRMPNMGAARELRNPSLKGLRFWPLTGFDEFLIFYLVEGDTVRVTRILARQARR